MTKKYKIVKVHKSDAYHGQEKEFNLIGMTGKFKEWCDCSLDGYVSGEFIPDNDPIPGNYVFLAVKLEEVK